MKGTQRANAGSKTQPKARRTDPVTGQSPRLNVRMTEEAAGELDEISAILNEPKAESLRICASLGAATVRARKAGQRVLIVETGDGEITGVSSIRKVIGELIIPIRVKPGVKPVEETE